MSEITEVSTTEKACGYQIGDWDCRPGGYMYDAGSGEGWDPEDCSFICPHCRTMDYLLDAKEEAESVSGYSNNGDWGTGVTIWAASEARALKANRPSAIRALIEIGVVHAIEDADKEDGFSVVLCNTQPTLALLADYDALATQRDEGLAREAELKRQLKETPIPQEIAAELERTDWTPKQALKWYAEGKHFDVVAGRTRIIDTGHVASNALKHLSAEYLEHKGDAQLHELQQHLAEAKRLLLDVRGQLCGPDQRAIDAFLASSGCAGGEKAQ